MNKNIKHNIATQTMFRACAELVEVGFKLKNPFHPRPKTFALAKKKHQMNEIIKSQYCYTEIINWLESKDLIVRFLKTLRPLRKSLRTLRLKLKNLRKSVTSVSSASQNLRFSDQKNTK